MSTLGQQLIAIALTVGLILVILELVRRNRLMERYAIAWLLSAVVLLALAAWRGLLSTISFDLGVHYPPALLFAVAFGAELLLLLHFSLSVSRLTDQNRLLAQRVGILQRRLDEHEARLAELTVTGARADAGGAAATELAPARPMGEPASAGPPTELSRAG